MDNDKGCNRGYTLLLPIEKNGTFLSNVGSGTGQSHSVPFKIFVISTSPVKPFFDMIPTIELYSLSQQITYQKKACESLLKMVNAQLTAFWSGMEISRLMV